MKRRGLTAMVSASMIIGLSFFLLFPVTTVLAIDNPDSTPSIVQFNAYRNVLETGDLLIIAYENTPYSTTPDMTYSESFIWRLKSTDGVSEYTQAVGYNYNDDGYGYNVISWYMDSGNVTATIGAGYWLQPYVVTLSGTPSAFDDPPIYNYTIGVSDYCSLTDTNEVKVAIAQRLLDIASDLDIRWGLSVTYSLLYAGEVGTTLSIYGQSFFRGAIYGVQGMAPSIFPLAITNVNTDDRTWTSSYATDLSNQYSGYYLETSFDAGKDFFDVDYNLMGILIVLAIAATIIGANWYLSGGNLWTGMTESVPVVVIGGRLFLLPMGELGLLAAVCWLYISAKTWRLI